MSEKKKGAPNKGVEKKVAYNGMLEPYKIEVIGSTKECNHEAYKHLTKVYNKKKKMRTIKFRAWLPDLNKMETGLFGLRSDGKASFNSDCVLMQFTGLTDKNGVEIFENDLVQHYAWDYPFIVIFDNEKARFVCKMGSGLTKSLEFRDLEVIGNTYEK